MKKLLSVVLSVVALTAFAKVNGSLKFIPAKVDGIICFDSVRGMNNSVISQAFKSNPEFKAGLDSLNAKLKTYGLQATDMIQDITVFVSNKDQSGAVVRTKLTNSLFKKMLSDGFFKKLNGSMDIQESKAGGSTIYSFPASCCGVDTAALPPNVNFSAPETMAFSYVDANHVLVADSKEIAKILTSVKVGSLANNYAFKSKLKDVDTNAMMWLLFDVPDNTAQGQQDPGIDLVGCSLSISDKKKDININGFVRCKSDQLAMQYAQQAQFMIMMFGGSIFKGDQQLAMDVTKAIKIKNQANDIKLNMVIPEDMQAKLKTFAEKAAKEKGQMMQGGGNMSLQPAPGGNTK